MPMLLQTNNTDYQCAFLHLKAGGRSKHSYIEDAQEIQEL